MRISCLKAAAGGVFLALFHTGAQASALPHDMSPLGMFFAADQVVKSVLIGLLVAALATWVVLLVKGASLLQARREASQAAAVLKTATSLPDAAVKVEGAGSTSLAQQLLAEVQQELSLSHASAPAAALKERAGFRQEQLIAHKVRSMTQGIGLLASIGAVAPFVGLFGTVWGIMNSFIGIAVSQSTNLATVAPGIAEALLATALGLVAAIPAVVIYNVLSRGINEYKAQLRAASAQVLLMLSRDLDTRQQA
ncbi:MULTISPECIES: tonB-system energizer ExbB [unclassified Janthinobacterium]|uniref:tonB-system energizer ExbB n=1 Tax=unclassified Janthinobacterium TaxID=2610881 RepID=UPI001E3FBA5B|nr:MULTISPECIES: tonB-system energizer ExbB [unclassified Janthinobacterium]MCC7643920.1 tonB-system energizer ExbB [Janthinobacterium sp. EB271-G4-3-1]MCC7691231.1 tonB-system energizer ExbB [Janthinobacterium sp. EB271-G4-3-2]